MTLIQSLLRRLTSPVAPRSPSPVPLQPDQLAAVGGGKSVSTLLPRSGF